MRQRTANPARFAVLAGTLLICLLPSLGAQTVPAVGQLFKKTEVLIPMRDGVRLNTEIYTPRSSRERLPFLLIRTPYGLGSIPDSLGSSYKELVDEGYLFVFQDIRGRFKSEGEFVMLRPPRKKEKTGAVDEATDTYDTIEWLLKNIPNHNGRVGVMGISYGGWLTVMAMIDPHPAVKAVSPQASPADMFIGDDFLHNGAFRLSPSFGYAAMMESGKTVIPFKFDQYDNYEWYLALGPLASANEKYFQGRLPTWNDFMAHPTYDEYWQQQEVSRYLDRVAVPTLNVAGWWDAEDFYGPMKIYETLEQKDSQKLNCLVVGPWRHGGWAEGDGRSLGKIDFAADTAVYFRQKVQAPWFAFFLKDKGNLGLPEALTFQTGSNRWESHQAWPPRQSTRERNLYFRARGRLAFDPPAEDSDQEFDAYISDPASPVPYSSRPIKPFWQGGGALWKVEDQRFAHLRPDVLSWQTDVLDEEVAVSGRIVARLYASTSGTDSDWIVKLIDVYPEDYPKNPEMGGYQLMVADEVLRARFRRSFEKPEPVVPDQVTEYVIDLNSRNHRFLKGHQIMVQVQSSWFPLIDRNPQKFVNIPTATEADYQKATQRLFRSRSFPSHLQLRVPGS